MSRKSYPSKGFTLIELLVVLGILAILLSITLIAINPARQFQQARDAQRGSDVLAILNVINQYSIDNDGALPGDGLGPLGGDMITTTPQLISTNESNICADLRPKYIAAIPIDPELATDEIPNVSDCSVEYNTGYTVVKNDAGRITVAAPATEIPPTKQITR